MTNFKDRIVRAAKLDPHLYDEVEADPSSMPQAMAVVVLSSLAAGVGRIFQAGIAGIIIGTVAALAGWYIWAYLIYFIGMKIFPEPQTKATPGELLRTIGFSSSPGIIRIAGIYPGIGGIVVFVASVWMLAAMVVAVRQALDYRSTWRAVGVCAIGWIIQMMIVFLLFSLGGAPGLSD